MSFIDILKDILVENVYKEHTAEGKQVKQRESAAAILQTFIDKYNKGVIRPNIPAELRKGNGTGIGDELDAIDTPKQDAAEQIDDIGEKQNEATGIEKELKDAVATALSGAQGEYANVVPDALKDKYSTRAEYLAGIRHMMEIFEPAVFTFLIGDTQSPRNIQSTMGETVRQENNRIRNVINEIIQEPDMPADIVRAFELILKKHMQQVLSRSRENVAESDRGVARIQAEVANTIGTQQEQGRTNL